MFRRRFWLAAGALVVILAGCSADPAPTPLASAVQRSTIAAPMVSASGTTPSSAPAQPSAEASAKASTLAANTVTGQITYLQRSALPPEAQVWVWLEDVSFADAPSVVLSEQTFEAGGNQVPFPFELPYEQIQIDARNRYNIRAEITLGEELLFVTTMAYPVITDGNPSSGVEVIVTPIE